MAKIPMAIPNPLQGSQRVQSDLPETNIGPENQWLEDDIPLEKPQIQGLCSFREGMYRILLTSFHPIFHKTKQEKNHFHPLLSWKDLDPESFREVSQTLGFHTYIRWKIKPEATSLLVMAGQPTTPPLRYPSPQK